MKADSGRPFAALSPDKVLQAAEALGLVPDGRLLALNSYENRVYRVGCEDAAPVVLKFYRAGRWSDAQIGEEHEFTLELAAAELPVAAPVKLGGRTLHHWEGLRIAAFEFAPGGAPDISLPGQLELLGRTLSRVHACGARRRFDVRPSLVGEALGTRARRVVLASELLPEGLDGRYGAVSERLLDAIEAMVEEVGPLPQVRLHGDCHLGNILWRPTGPLFVDLDDCMNGPRIQDLWMFLSGNPDEQNGQWQKLIEGYRQFGDLDWAELRLIEALRGARMLRHAAWVAERWEDPAFPAAFPWFAEVRFWENYCNDLAEQCEAVSNPPVVGS